MTKQRKLAQVLRFGLGAAILASAAFTSGSVQAQTAVICSAGGSRELARLSVSRRDSSICIRQFLGVPVPPNTPSCWEAARDNNLSCVDPATGRVTIVDL